MAENTVKGMTTNFEKPDKFKGHDFRRWQKKMHFLLTTWKVIYALTTAMPELLVDVTPEAIRIRAKRENNDYICMGHILNGMRDSLFDILYRVGGDDFVENCAKELWDSLESKYMADDAFCKKLLILNMLKACQPEKVICLDDKSVKINEEANSLNNGVEESDSDVVSDTYFCDNGEDQGLEHQHGESSNAKEVSSDPFNIYGLLDKRTQEVRTTDTTTSIPYPSGFTPVNEIPASIKQDAPEVESNRPPNRSEMSNSRVLEEVSNSVDKISSESINNGIKLKEGGSILEILEEMITVGQTMGVSMEGCTKDMEKII
nr:zinc finger, CCHC-type [Tanacetum cinerariifolium]